MLIQLLLVLMSGDALQTAPPGPGDATPAWAARPAQARPTLRAVVADETGAVIIGAKLALVNAGTQETREAVSDEAGRAAFDALPPGEYVLRAEAAGFKRLERAIRVTTEPLEPLNLRLEIEVTAEITITGNRRAPRESQEVVDLDNNMLTKAPVPMGGRQLLEFLGNFLAPSAQSTGPMTVVVDGVEVSRLGLPSAGIKGIIVNKNSYSPEYRRPGKARVEIITEDGSRNHFQGNAGFFRGNSIFDARNAFADEKPETEKTLVEGGVGGPLPGVRGAFLLTGEYLRDRQSRVVNAQTLTGPFVETVPTFEGYTYALARVDLRPNNLFRLMARYDFARESQRNDGVGGLRLREQAVNSRQIEHGLRLTANSILSAAFANDLRVSVEHNTDREGTAAADGPKIIVRGAFEGGSSQTFTSERSRELQIQDTATYFRGAHTIRFGGRSEAKFLRASDRSNFGGTFEFARLDLLGAGTASVFRINQGTPEVDFSMYEVDMFFQDEIKFGRAFTVMVGGRYDWQSALQDSNNVAPRLAFAFVPGQGRTVLRGGAGMFYERLSETIVRKTLLFNGTRTRELVISNPTYPTPFGTGQARLTPPSLVRVSPDLETPHLTQAGLGLERELWGLTFLTVEYSHLRGVHLFRARNANAPLPGTGLRPDPTVLNITQIESSASVRSHALSATFTGSVGSDFDGIATYSYSRSTNNVGGGPFRFPADNYDLAPEMGRADFDIRHKFSLIGVHDLPTHDFEVGAVLTLASGAPFDITTGFDDNGDTEATDRPAGVTRNTGEGPGFAELDLRLTKKFDLGRSLESVTQPGELVINLDAFNVLNRTNYYRVIGVRSSPFFGQPNAARAARSVQLSLRYSF